MLLTHENRNRLRATVFGKTAAGRAELSRRSVELPARQRSVLILLDGRRTLAEIDTWLPEDEMLAAIESLVRRGLVAIGGDMPQQAPEAAPAPAASGPALGPVKAMMAEAARKHLGLMAADLLRRIEQAGDNGQLAAVIGLWHVSLRESKTGKQCAEPLLREARALLA